MIPYEFCTHGLHCGVSIFKGGNRCHQGKRLNKSALNRWILTLALSFPIDRESPRSYASLATDVGRSAPRERRGTPEKEVVRSRAFQFLSVRYLKTWPVKLRPKPLKNTD